MARACSQEPGASRAIFCSSGCVRSVRSSRRARDTVPSRRPTEPCKNDAEHARQEAADRAADQVRVLAARRGHRAARCRPASSIVLAITSVALAMRGGRACQQDVACVGAGRAARA